MYRTAETWTTAQALFALTCREEDVTVENLAEYAHMITQRFTSYDYDPKEGAWTSDTFRTSSGNTLTNFEGLPHSTPALWLLRAIATVKKVNDRQPDRPYETSLLDSLGRTKSVVEKFRGSDGGWRMLLSDAQSNPFSTCYAILALLELKRSGLTFSQSTAEDRTTISNAVHCLVNQLQQRDREWGWSENSSEGPIRLALTCHCLTTLMEADEQGIPLDPGIRSRVHTFITEKVSRIPADIYAVESGMYEGHAVHFLYYPWALGCCTEYIKWLDRNGQSAQDKLETRIIVRRLVSELVLSEKDRAGITYQLAFGLQGLSRVR